nr:SGNH/GDSL hydrolase family protein [Pseudopedobacter sp.]
MFKRREFIKKTSLAGLMAISLPEIVNAAIPSSTRLKLVNSDIILFQGDSITDSGRKKDDSNYNNPTSLGSGYVVQATGDLLLDYADKGLKIYNKGISGNKVYQLAERWDADCLQIKPNLLSILIGVNDYWHKHDGKYNGTIEIYNNDFRGLLNKTKAALPQVKLIIMEPYALKGIKAVDDTWYPEFDEYRFAAKQIAKEFNAQFIPLQTVFDEAIKVAPGEYWSADGVHPTLAGAKLIAHAWTKVVKG